MLGRIVVGTMIASALWFTPHVGFARRVTTKTRPASFGDFALRHRLDLTVTEVGPRKHVAVLLGENHLVDWKRGPNAGTLEIVEGEGTTRLNAARDYVRRIRGGVLVVLGLSPTRRRDIQVPLNLRPVTRYASLAAITASVTPNYLLWEKAARK
jgi:hypothetical protein